MELHHFAVVNLLKVFCIVHKIEPFFFGKDRGKKIDLIKSFKLDLIWST